MEYLALGHQVTMRHKVISQPELSIRSWFLSDSSNHKYKGITIHMDDSVLESMEARRQQNIFKVLKEKHFQTRILPSVIIYFKKEGEVKSFSDG